MKIKSVHITRLHRRVDKLIDQFRVHQVLELYRERLGDKIDYVSNWDMRYTDKNDWRLAMLLASYSDIDSQELIEIASELGLDPPESFEINDAGVTWLQPINLVNPENSIFKIFNFNAN